MPPRKKEKVPKIVVANKHADKRMGIPTAEEQSYVPGKDLAPIPLRYPRNPDLDPQLVWRGKDEQDARPLEVKAMPIYIQEKIHPKLLINDLMAQTKAKAPEAELFLFQDFNGVPEGVNKTDFYHYDKNWSNRMILGDSLQVMASLAEKEGLRGKVQCIYIDPPYGIKFNSNFQWSTTTTQVKDGKLENITREPEMVKAFRDTWNNGVHSYLSYLRDRFLIARELLANQGSVFLQISEENLHRIRLLLDEVFGEDNFVTQIHFRKTGALASGMVDEIGDYILWYCKSKKDIKFRKLFDKKAQSKSGLSNYQNLKSADLTCRSLTKDEKNNYENIPDKSRLYGLHALNSQSGGEKGRFPIHFKGKTFNIFSGSWKTNEVGIKRLTYSSRIDSTKERIGYIRFLDDFDAIPLTNLWDDTRGEMNPVYVVQTGTKIIERCILMTTDPGDLVLDPTCGSGTTAYVAEQWGRRWITIDTSRVALALARARLMGARYPYYLLADSPEGQKKEGELQQRVPSTAPTYGDIRHGFVYERIPHITLKSIANNAEIDVIWDNYAAQMDPLRQKLGGLEEWQIPREGTPEAHKLPADVLKAWWTLRLARQKAMDASIAAKAEFEYLYDKPYADNSKIRVAGPFTVESLDPHRMLGVDENGGLIDPIEIASKVEDYRPVQDFTSMILENLRTAGVQHSDKKDKIVFESLAATPGKFICAEGKYMRGERQIRAGIFIGPEFGTVNRADLAEAAREAGDRKFDELIACAFNYDAHASEIDKLGAVPIIKARMNADLHMGGELKNTGAGNLFVVFGEPDIEILHQGEQLRVKINGVDIFKPQSGKVESSGVEGIACWFIDTNYNEESFFVRHAYFLGQNDPYDGLKRTLKAEIDPEAWESLHSAVSRPFDRPETGRIAVKIINHLGDEVLKVYGKDSF